MKLSISNLTNSPIEARNSENKRVVFPAAGIKAPPVKDYFEGEGLNLIRFWESLGSITVSEEVSNSKGKEAELAPEQPLNEEDLPVAKPAKKGGKKKG